MLDLVDKYIERSYPLGNSFGIKKRKVAKRKVKSIKKPKSAKKLTKKTVKKPTKKPTKKVSKGPSKTLKTQAKRYGIKLTLKRADKRVYKTEKVLRQQIKTKKAKMVKKPKSAKKSNNNYGSRPSPTPPFVGPQPGYDGKTNYFPGAFNLAFYPSPSPNKRMMNIAFP